MLFWVNADEAAVLVNASYQFLK